MANLDTTYPVCVSKSAFPNRKPDATENAMIRTELARPDAKRLCTVVQIHSLLSKHHTFLFGDFQGGTREANWKSQRLFALDFDNDETIKARGLDILDPDDALMIAFDSGLDPLILYFTKSATVEPWNPRYRIIFDAGILYTDSDKAKSYAKSLEALYPECDRCSTRLAQMYHSGGGEIWPVYRLKTMN